MEVNENESSWRKTQDDSIVAAALIFWTAIIVIGALFVLMGIGMSVEATKGYEFSRFLFVVTVCSYPALIAVAFFLRRKARWTALLPAVPIILILLSIRHNW